MKLRGHVEGTRKSVLFPLTETTITTTTTTTIVLLLLKYQNPLRNLESKFNVTKFSQSNKKTTKLTSNFINLSKNIPIIIINITFPKFLKDRNA